MRNSEVRMRKFNSDFDISHSAITMGRFQSGQMDQTVNLLSYDFGGSNPPLPTEQLVKDELVN